MTLSTKYEQAALVLIVVAIIAKIGGDSSGVLPIGSIVCLATSHILAELEKKS